MKSFRWVYIKFSILLTFFVSTASFWIVAVHQDSQFEVSNPYPFIQISNLFELYLFVVGTSILIAGIVGIFIGVFVNRPIRNLNDFLSDVEKGNYPENFEKSNIKEFEELGERTKSLSARYKNQSLAIQDKTNEYAESKQSIFEEAIAVERGRLARELHDSVSQQLFAISMMSSALYAGMQDDGMLKEQMGKLEYMSVQAQSEMRALLLHLRPVQLEGKKLATGISELLTELSAKQNLEVVWHVDDIELEMGVEDHLFRILQEAISNTLRHAKATKLEVSLRKINLSVTLKIIDNGSGFDINGTTALSYGLGTMNERTSEIGGTIKILSAVDVGTQIEIRIPLDEDGDEIGKD